MTKKTSQKNLLKKVEKNIIENNLIKSGDIVYAAVSGGADSICLLSILVKLSTKLDFELRACHYNHKLRGAESDKDEQFVKDVVKEWGIELISAERKNEPCKSEEEARGLRYSFFEKILKKSRGAKIVIAHNSGDLSETLLMRLIRGTGLRGLKSIPQRRENFVRPLLPFSRAEILEHLKSEKIKFRVDKSNFDNKFLRNKIRQKLIPELKTYNPNIEIALGRLVRSSEIDYSYIEDVADKEFKKIAIIENKKIKIDRKKFILLHSSIKYHLLVRSFCEIGVISDISESHIKDVLRMVKKNTGKKEISLPHSLRVRLIGGKIIVLRG